MPEDDKKIQHTGQYDEPAYSGEDIPGQDEVKIPDGVPQEHLIDSSPISSAPVEKASKSQILKRFLMILLGIAVLIAAGIAAWKLIPSKDEKQTPANTAQNQQQTTENADPVNLALGDTHLTKTYTSDALGLEFKYPQGWVVSEQNNSVMVKSPEFNLTAKDGSNAPTFFKVYIKRGATEAEGKYLGNGYAVAPSEKLDYTDPAPGQRKTTFLTDFGLGTADNFAYSVVQGNFELAKGDTLGPKYASEPDSFLVSGGFATQQQKDGLETIELPMDSYKQNLAYKTGIQIIQSLQLK
jgi:hypothetical protein